MKKLTEEYNVPVSFRLAEKLYRLGYAVGTPQCITCFDSDFVYDGDPGHPESHKAGEIRMYGFYHKNNQKEPGLFECPSAEMLSAWLLTEYQIHVSPKPSFRKDGSLGWTYSVVYLLLNGKEIQFDAIYETRTQATLAAMEAVIDEILISTGVQMVRPEQFF